MAPKKGSRRKVPFVADEVTRLISFIAAATEQVRASSRRLLRMSCRHRNDHLRSPKSVVNMPRASSLPGRLRYLQPFRKKFGPPNEPNEDTGFAPLLALLRKRVAGLPSNEAEKLLEEDIIALNDWLAEPSQQNDPLHFAAGVFLIASPADLLQQIKEEGEKAAAPQVFLVMDLPERARRRKLPGVGNDAILFFWKELMVSLQILTEEAIARASENVSNGAMTVSSVQYEVVSGQKYSDVTENRFGRPLKRVSYALRVPGGNVEVSINFMGKRPGLNWTEEKMREFIKIDESKWDESPIEAQFHTISIITQ
ncbi:MAG: hypothetical protein JWM68_1110 [Verrucomicrobiales bacterium]|nr:hypothetical protein [Verrucomicrobiales bacterium]